MKKAYKLPIFTTLGNEHDGLMKEIACIYFSYNSLIEGVKLSLSKSSFMKSSLEWSISKSFNGNEREKMEVVGIVRYSIRLQYVREKIGSYNQLVSKTENMKIVVDKVSEVLKTILESEATKGYFRVGHPILLDNTNTFKDVDEIMNIESCQSDHHTFILGSKILDGKKESELAKIDIMYDTSFSDEININIRKSCDIDDLIKYKLSCEDMSLEKKAQVAGSFNYIVSKQYLIDRDNKYLFKNKDNFETCSSIIESKLNELSDMTEGYFYLKRKHRMYSDEAVNLAILVHNEKPPYSKWEVIAVGESGDLRLDYPVPSNSEFGRIKFTNDYRMAIDQFDRMYPVYFHMKIKK